MIFGIAINDVVFNKRHFSFQYIILSKVFGLACTGETLSHELLGHGLSREEGSISYRHEDAIQMTNLYWRVKGKYNFYRDGSDHFNKNVLDRKTANDIPNYLK